MMILRVSAVAALRVNTVFGAETKVSSWSSCSKSSADEESPVKRSCCTSSHADEGEGSMIDSEGDETSEGDEDTQDDESVYVNAGETKSQFLRRIRGEKYPQAKTTLEQNMRSYHTSYGNRPIILGWKDSKNKDGELIRNAKTEEQKQEARQAFKKNFEDLYPLPPGVDEIWLRAYSVTQNTRTIAMLDYAIEHALLGITLVQRDEYGEVVKFDEISVGIAGDAKGQVALGSGYDPEYTTVKPFQDFSDFRNEPYRRTSRPDANLPVAHVTNELKVEGEAEVKALWASLTDSIVQEILNPSDISAILPGSSTIALSPGLQFLAGIGGPVGWLKQRWDPSIRYANCLSWIVEILEKAGVELTAYVSIDKTRADVHSGLRIIPIKLKMLPTATEEGPGDK